MCGADLRIELIEGGTADTRKGAVRRTLHRVAGSLSIWRSGPGLQTSRREWLDRTLIP
jgi:hypothetical protein